MISGERAGEERESLVRILSNQKSTKSSHMSCTILFQAGAKNNNKK